ncbi:MAG: DUF4831 family protein [Bryobacteraceae bacterium]
MRRCLVICSALSLLLGGCAKIVVVPVPSGGSTPAEGVIYALPNTVIQVHLKIDKTTKKGAPYAVYAAVFAPDTKPVCEDQACSKGSTEYAVEDGATFTTYGEPDPEEVFLVKFSKGGAVDQSLTMTWNDAGLLSGASSTVTNRTGDIIVSGIKLAASVASKTAFGSNKALAANKLAKKNCSDVIPGSGEDAADDWFIQELNTKLTAKPEWANTLITNYCTIAKEDRAKLPQDKDLVEDAIDAYTIKIIPLADTRATLLRGTGTALDAVPLIARIETEIGTQLIPLFIGTKTTIVWDGALDTRAVRKGASVPVDLSILIVDPKAGICIQNVEVPPGVKPLPFVAAGATAKVPADQFATIGCSTAPEGVKDYHLTLDYQTVLASQLFNKITDVTTGDRSFRYRIPAQMKAKFGEKTKSIGSGTFPVAQLGTVISLPAQRHSKSLTYNLGFTEATGALKTFTLGTTGSLDAGTIDALSGAAGGVLDARTAAIQKAQTNADPATALTKQDTLLKLQDDICTIQKKYNLPCTIQPQ